MIDGPRLLTPRRRRLEQALALFDATHDLHNRHHTLVNIARALRWIDA